MVTMMSMSTQTLSYADIPQFIMRYTEYMEGCDTSMAGDKGRTIVAKIVQCV